MRSKKTNGNDVRVWMCVYIRVYMCVVLTKHSAASSINPSWNLCWSRKLSARARRNVSGGKALFCEDCNSENSSCDTQRDKDLMSVFSLKEKKDGQGFEWIGKRMFKRNSLYFLLTIERKWNCFETLIFFGISEFLYFLFFHRIQHWTLNDDIQTCLVLS